ncbi:FkbM family methyltransferase [Magnetospirillum molischianum]|nr:FkbM family methyltransferase [Magnetospirillum molischianum]
MLLDLRSGRRLEIRLRTINDWCTAKQVFFDNDYGFEKLARGGDLNRRFDEIVESGHSPLILDCGGNIGLAARFFAETYPQAEIVSIEPDRDNIEQAKINTATTKVTTIEAAIASNDGNGTLIDPGLGNNGYRVHESADGAVRLISVNTLIADARAKKCVPFLIKIDIEGFESELFSKNTEWIEAFPILIIELHDWMLPKTANAANFLKTISQLNRDFVFHGENVFSIANDF